MEAVPATDDDRRGAFDELKELLSSGRIDAAEFATRSSEISGATTLAELAALVTAEGRAPAPAGPAGQANPSYGSVPGGTTTTARSRSVGRFAMTIGVRGAVLWLVGLAVAAGGAFAVSQLAASTGTGSPSGPATPPGATQATAEPPAKPQLLTRAGLAKLRSDMRITIGSTRYLSAVVYPDYATIEVPVTGDPDHARRWYYNGSFGQNPIVSPRRPGSKAADLRDVDVPALTRAIRRAPARLKVRSADQTYLIFDSRAGRPVMSVYVTGPSSSTGYWTMRLDGRTITRHQAP